MAHSITNPEWPSHTDFDKWLTELPIKKLKDLCKAFDPFAEGKSLPSRPKYMASLILHFTGQPLSVREIVKLMPHFGTNLTVELLKREGHATKWGCYSIDPANDEMLVTML
jgi:hypothetical protein